ncbi:hypothetical protein [Vibrio genomosp. F10]|uniref:hypothetical protein n=1 Tax=Vibrio genomosp. F10 TaxID=723171 RepID=UPI000369048E|nr:hypothetical protein [Vibrio genomosp. F10]OEF09555.1 hypothetical protein A1QI_13980 [Vibrio genomosp. F10 str. 9ZB36]
MNTLTKIKKWLSNTELAKTYRFRGMWKSPIFFILALFISQIYSPLEQAETCMYLALLTTYMYLVFIRSFNDNDNIFTSTLGYIKDNLHVVLTMVVVTFFEVLYIWSYSPKFLIPESLMEAVLLGLPAFKFCVFIYAVTLSRMRNEAIEKEADNV